MGIKKLAAVIAALAAFFCAVTPPLAAAPAAPDEAEVRGVVQRIFGQLKSGRYDSLYEALPSSSRGRFSRERFTNALRRTQDMYELDRMEIGAVRVDGDFAVVDTVMYGRVLRPIQSEGKIVAQQYMVREDGKWRVATGDRGAIQRFLADHPRVAKKFPLREPRVYIKRDGQWVDLSNSLKAAARRRVG